MSLLDSEIIWRPASLVSSTTPAQNGGRMAYTQMVSGMKNNLFPDVSKTERDNGATLLRKAFIHLNNTSDTPLTSCKVFLDAVTPGDDYVLFFPGTATNTEDTMGSARPYGVGTLTETVDIGFDSLRVTVENIADYTSLTPFRVGDLVRVSNQPSTGGAGTTDWVILSAVSYQPTYVELTFATTPLANAYVSGATTIISSVLEVASCGGSVTNISKTSTNGLFDGITTGNLVSHNKGGVSDTWTITFLTQTTFNVSGAATGLLPGTGSILADYSPTNVPINSPYFTLKALCWDGNWVAGDTVTFDSTPAQIPVWYRRRVPTGAGSLANNATSLAVHGESV